MKAEATDWTAYYQKPRGAASLTRRITIGLLKGCLSKALKGSDLQICEFGGANSCIAPMICETFDVGRYHVVDTNPYGLSLIDSLDVEAEVTGELESVLSLPQTLKEKFDLVVSVGLIEHFDKADTRAAIQSHIEACRFEGIVLITFPTPKWPYGLIRGVAEKIGVWAFPDERPLKFSEVEAALPADAQILVRKINRWIGLTQGVIMVRKTD